MKLDNWIKLKQLLINFKKMIDLKFRILDELSGKMTIFEKNKEKLKLEKLFDTGSTFE